jgi:aryl-alcohol dehydrogenase-like predicted oxidoreductase
MSEQQDFSHCLLPSVNKRVFRLGLAGNYGIDTADAEYAADRGVNYWLWGWTFRKMTPALQRILAKDRESHVVAVLGSAFLAGGARRGVEKALRKLGTDYIDIFKLGWLGRTSRLSSGIEKTLLALQKEGKVRSLGCSIHDRKRAAKLVQDSALDTFMLRYNAKHPGAEKDIFPHLIPDKTSVVAYTATSWQQLLKPLKNVEMPAWPGPSSEQMPPLTAALCYRFCLSNPNVHVTLTGPKTRAQLDQNIAALEAGPLSDDELAWVRQYGAIVKKKKKMDYV